MRHPPAWMVLCALASTAYGQSASPAESAPRKPDGPPSPAAGSGLRLSLPPVLWSGSLSLDFSRQQSNSEPSSQLRLFTFRLGAASYVYAPWAALVNASLGLSKGTSTSSGFAAENGSTQFLTGELQTSIFPRSRFPTDLRFSVSDSRIDPDASPGVAYRGRNFGVIQRYRPPNEEFRVTVSYDRSIQEGADFGRTSQDALFADFASKWKRHQISAVLAVNKNRSDRSGDESGLTSLVARHGTALDTPTASMSVENSASWTQTDDRHSAGDGKQTMAQLSSVGIWRAKELPLTATGSLRAFSLKNNDAASSESLALALGASYELTRNMRLNGSLSLSRSNALTSVASAGQLSLNYQGDQRQIAGAAWSWYSGASLGLLHNDRQSDATGSVQIGHSLARTWPAGSSTWTASFAQGLSAASTTRPAANPDDHLTSDRTTRALSQSVSLGWSQPGEWGVAFARLSFSDARLFDGEQAHVQQLNFQLSGNHTIDRNRSWTADLSVQRFMQSNLEEQPTGPLPSVVQVRQQNQSASGGVSYNHGRLFNVPRLNFESRVRLSVGTQSQSNQLLAPPDRETASWENRLTYRVGLLDSTLSLRVAKVDARQHVFAMWRLQRTF